MSEKIIEMKKRDDIVNYDAEFLMKSMAVSVGSFGSGLLINNEDVEKIVILVERSALEPNSVKVRFNAETADGGFVTLYETDVNMDVVEDNRETILSDTRSLIDAYLEI